MGSAAHRAMQIAQPSVRAVRPVDPGYRARREPPRERPPEEGPKAAKAKIIDADFSPAPLPYPGAFLAHLLGQVMMPAQKPVDPYSAPRKPRLGLLADETV